MADGKGRGWNAKAQMRNDRGQFAAAAKKDGAREVICISSDDEVSKPRVRRHKGETSSPIPAKTKSKREASTPTRTPAPKIKVRYDSDMEDSSFAFNEEEEEDDLELAASMSHWLFGTAENKINKRFHRRPNKLVYAVDKSMDSLLVDVKYQVLDQVGLSNKCSVQAMREFFDAAKEEGKNHIIESANQMCKDIDT